MSIHINFYKVNLANFYTLVGSKDEDFAAQAIFVIENRIRQYRGLDEGTRELCVQIVRQIIFEGKIPDQVDPHLPRPTNEWGIEVSREATFFEVEQALLAIFNKVAIGKEYDWLSYGEVIEIYNELTSNAYLTQKQAELWNFLLMGRSLLDETFPRSWWMGGYSYLTEAEIELVLESLTPLVDLSQENENNILEEESFNKTEAERYLYSGRQRELKLRNNPHFSRTHFALPDSESAATRLYKILRSCANTDLFVMVG